MQPNFVRYVSSVQGRLVHRWDALGSFIGARRATPEERAEGADPVIWDTSAVLPLTDEFCRRFDKELRRAIAHGDLIEWSVEDLPAPPVTTQEQE